MTACLESCKWTCITAYILASLGSFVLFYNMKTKEGQAKPFIPSNMLLWLYLIGAVVTISCSLRWACAKPANVV